MLTLLLMKKLNLFLSLAFKKLSEQSFVFYLTVNGYTTRNSVSHSVITLYKFKTGRRQIVNSVNKPEFTVRQPAVFKAYNLKARLLV